MTYNPSIPQSGDDPKVSQGQILSNFSVLASDFSINHVPLTSGANPGFHQKIYFSGVQASDPNLPAPQNALYPKTGSSGNPELFFQNGALPSNVKQLTNLPIFTSSLQNALNTNPARITSNNHGLTTGNSIVINGVYGMTQLNGNTYIITVIDANTFTLNGIDATAFGVYVSGGYFTIASQTRYGFISPWGPIFNTGQATGTTAFFSAPYNSGGFTIYFASAGGTSNIFISSVLFDRITFSSSVTNAYYLVIGQ